MSMKKRMCSLGAAIALMTGGIDLVGAAEHAHYHDAGGGEAPALSLDAAGKRWTTDAPLREAMGRIHDAVTQALPKVHKDALDGAGYEALATRIDSEVAYMVSHCKLAPDADAQLHLVIAEMMAGADIMRGKTEGQPPRRGVIQVKKALGLYAEYFDDPAFVHQADHKGH